MARANGLRALVTGAAGFIGSHVVDRLLGEGCRVWGLDNFDPFYDRAMKEANLAGARSSPNFVFREGDLRDGPGTADLIGGADPDVVIHLAARAGVRPSIERPVEYYEQNVMGTLQLLEAMRAAGVGALVFGSSSSVYGADTEERPFRESDVTDRPVSPYAASKRAGELLCHTYAHLHGFAVYCLRLFTVYGPRQRPDLAIRKFTEALARGAALPIYGDGGALRDYTYVDDTVDAIVRAARELSSEASGPVFEVMNIGAGRTVSVSELVAVLARTLDVEPRIERLPEQPGDVPRTWADITRARRALGYEPRVAIEEGLARFVEWFREASG